MKTVSLFSSYGLGDLGLRAAGADITLMAELLEKRCGHLRRNFPESEVVCGNLEDDWEAVVARAEKLLNGEPLHLLVATPPCQGMSTNGAGKLAAAVREGKRPKDDPRNRLILPALKIAKRLRPRWIVFENVVPMRNTAIMHGGRPRKILDIVDGMLRHAGYRGGAATVDFRRHGVPQDRQRLITVYGLGETREIDDLLPPDSGDPPTLKDVIGHFERLGDLPMDSGSPTLKDVIGHFEELGGLSSDWPPPGWPALKDVIGQKLESADDPLHRVKKMNEYHYWWTRRITESGGTAYDNPCKCGWSNEPKEGKQTPDVCPAYCGCCGRLLPRPTTPVGEVDGETLDERRKRGCRGCPGPCGCRRIINGFRTAYKRMEWDRPAPTVTMNLMTPSSDNKLHPEQNRTLSPAEAAAIQTVDRYPYDWGDASDRELCDALGEAVPPLFFERLLRHLVSISG